MAFQAAIRLEATSPDWGLFVANVEGFCFYTWLRRMELARSAFGGRCMTSHVPEGEWLEHWRAGMDPASAVIERLDQF